MNQLARLEEMVAAIDRLERELPDDARPLGIAARARARGCIDRIRRGESDPDDLNAALDEIARIMDALTERLLLSPWDRPPSKS